tara:strand:- start:393 stop:584 length:192 start_codon:yes stop_codon:yes gene_type:complete
MTSLDGYSLNKKIDQELDKINERIDAVHFRIEEEIEYIKANFQKLTKVASKKKEKKNAVSESM